MKRLVLVGAVALLGGCHDWSAGLAECFDAGRCRETGGAGGGGGGAGGGTSGPTLPSAPTSVGADAGNQSAHVTWVAPLDNGGSTIVHYTVSVVDGGAVSTVLGTSADITGLTNGAEYVFAVVASNTIGDGPAGLSNAVVPKTVPGAPTGVTAQGGNAAAAVQWTAPADNGGDTITSYVVSVSPMAGTVAFTGPSQATVSGLTNGVAYTFTVAAVNGVGTGPFSSASGPVTPAAVPDAPTNVTATAGNTQATVMWTASTSGGSAVTHYTVTSSPGGVMVMTANGTTTQATVTGLTNGTAYTFTVVATNMAGDSLPSLPSNSVTPDVVPAAPTAVTATAGNAQAMVSWTAPAPNGGGALTHYTVTSTPGSLTATTPNGTTTTATVTGLTNGTSYTFTVVATNSAGDSAPSAASSAVVPSTVPDAPTMVTATRGDKQVTVTWTAPFNEGSALTGYTVTSTPGSFTASAGGAATQATVTGLTNGTSYTFTVKATNARGTGPASMASNAVVPATTPSAPTQVAALSRNTGALVRWQPPFSNGGIPLTGYQVVATPGGATASANGVTTQAVVTGLTNGTGYTFKVTAQNAAGSGPASTASNTVKPQAACFFTLGEPVFQLPDNGTDLAVGDFNGDSKQDLAVIGINIGLNVMLNGSLGLAAPATTAGSAQALVAAKMDSDPRTDLVSTQGGVSICLASPTGTFGSPTNYSAGGFATVLLTGEFTGDSDTDVLLASSSGPSQLFPGSVTGVLGNPLTVNLNGSFVTSGDYNKDGNLDLVAVGNGMGLFYRGVGDGTFDAGVANIVDGLSAITLDANHDNRLDVITASGGVLYTNLGSGNGAFSYGGMPSISNVASVTRLASGDVNGDGWTDLLVGGTTQLQVMLNNQVSAGLFSQGASYSNLFNPMTADFNGDNKLDVASLSGQFVSVALGAGDGTFGPTALTASNTVVGLATGDFNADGRPDFALPMNGNIAVFLSTGATGYQTQTTVTAPSNLSAVAVGDLNGDGRPDLLVGDNGGHVYVLLATGAGTFAAPITYTTGAQVFQIAVGDFNGDGPLDVAAGTTSNVNVFLNTGNGALQAAATLTPPGTIQRVAAADVNRDGMMDLVVISQGASKLQLFTSTGGGNFSGAPPISVGLGPFALALGDLNNDGVPDAVVVSGGSSVSLVLGVSGAASTFSAAGSSTYTLISVADVDGDGNLDILAGDRYPGVDVYYGNGAGSFPRVARQRFTTDANGLAYITVADLNADGRPDLAGAGGSTAYVGLNSFCTP